jgi:hypothetical protein
MSRAQQTLGLGIVLAFTVGLGYAGWRMVRTDSGGEICLTSERPIHANMRTVAVVDNKRQIFCCPACALSAGNQTHNPVRFEQIADYETGHPLRPADAFAVEGSGVIPCLRPHEMANRDGLVVPLDFDRCSPSIIAFSSRSSADKFASEYGGRVGTFLQIVSHTATNSASPAAGSARPSAR